MPHDISTKTLQRFLDMVPWSKVLQKTKTTPKGHRVFPSQTPRNDASNNFRLDRGSDVEGVPEILLQANKNAEDRKVKEAAQKDSHAILAKGMADPSKTDVKDQIAADFKKRKSS